MKNFIWNRKSKKQRQIPAGAVQSVQSSEIKTHPFWTLENISAMEHTQNFLFDQIRDAVPIVDAAIGKIIRLTGSFTLESPDKAIQQELEDFQKNIRVGPTLSGLDRFIDCYLDNLLTYGNAAGEMIPLVQGDGIGALCNVPLKSLVVKQVQPPVGIEFWTTDNNLKLNPVQYPERILFTALNPKAGEINGRSLLAGLPFVSSILMDIYQAIGQNFERMGNLRFAVTYKPQENMDGVSAREIAEDMARQWSDTMNPSGRVKDFIAVGDVDIKVIGADNQIIDTQIPVRQMLEQIIAKLGIPPFILGLSWSTTERMSQQQSEILASELESYRSLLSSVILRICRYHLALKGMAGEVFVKWKPFSITDEVESARAEYLRAQAYKIREQSERKK